MRLLTINVDYVLAALFLSDQKISKELRGHKGGNPKRKGMGGGKRDYQGDGNRER